MPTAAPNDVFLDIHFPAAGIDLSRAFSNQQARQIGEGMWARTTPVAVNVRVYDPESGRGRGGSRPGLETYLEAPVDGWINQQLAVLVTSGDPVQLSASGRVVRLVTVSQGTVYTAVAGDDSWTTPTNTTGDDPSLNLNGLIYSAPLNGKLYFFDGSNWVYYDGVSETVNRWEASAGALPVDDENNTPRLGCTWRGRVIATGLLKSPQAVHASAVDDATDWDYAPAVDPTTGSVPPTSAFALTVGREGNVGDYLNSVCPYDDDRLLLFCDHSLYMLSGDPMFGGKVDVISQSIGGVWGVCWEMGVDGTVYFVSNKMGIYALDPRSGGKPQRISQAIDQLIQSVNTGEKVIRLLWDDVAQGLHVFMTTGDEPSEDTHYFWEARTQGWFQQVFANDDHNPLCCCVMDGNRPEDRVALIGSWDGAVRAFNNSATDDDGTAIASRVVFGPLLTPNLDDVLFKSTVAVLGANSNDVDWSVRLGATAEVALSADPVLEGSWSSGRNPADLIRRSGHALYLDCSGVGRINFEQISATLVPSTGKVRRRA